jgi:hypothetical protein
MRVPFDRRQFLKLVTVAPAVALLPALGQGSLPDPRAPASGVKGISKKTRIDPHWAFRLDGVLSVTGALFRYAGWGEGMCPSAARYLAETHYRNSGYEPVWGSLEPERILESALSSQVFVAMFDPEDADAFLEALEFALQVSMTGTLALLLAARPHPALFVMSGTSHPNFETSDTYREYLDDFVQSQFCFEVLFRLGHAKDPERTLREPKVCLLGTVTSDPCAELVEMAAPFADGWRGCMGLDLQDVCEVLGAGRIGWSSRGTGLGHDRAVQATRLALQELKWLKVNVAEATGMMVTVTARPDLRLSEMRAVMNVVRSRLSSQDTQILWAHQEQPGGLTVSIAGVNP